MLNPELPHRAPFVGPHGPYPLDRRRDVLERPSRRVAPPRSTVSATDAQVDTKLSEQHEALVTHLTATLDLERGSVRSWPLKTRGHSPMDHVPFGDTPASRCHYYRRVCDLPAHIDPPHLGRIVHAGRIHWR